MASRRASPLPRPVPTLAVTDVRVLCGRCAFAHLRQRGRSADPQSAAGPSLARGSETEESRTASGCVVHRDGPIVRGGDPLGDRESQPGPARSIASDAGQAGERLEDTIALGGRDPRPFIDHRELDSAVRSSDRHPDRRPRRRVVERVVDEDEDELGQPVAIARHGCRYPGFVAGFEPQFDLVASRPGHPPAGRRPARPPRGRSGVGRRRGPPPPMTRSAGGRRRGARVGRSPSRCRRRARGLLR